MWYSINMKKNPFGAYIEYLKDNPEGYWFKRKAFGWGWTPVKWQGWLVTVLYIAGVFAFASTLEESSSGREAAFMFFLPLLLLTAAIITIAYKKGEKPKWQWGLPDRQTGLSRLGKAGLPKNEEKQ